jgi:hypothetical protein
MQKVDYVKYLDSKKEFEEKQKVVAEELKVIANRFFSTEDGRKYANQLLTAVHYFDVLPSNLTDNDLRYVQAQRDFVNVFLIGLIKKETLIDIIKDRNNGK